MHKKEDTYILVGIMSSLEDLKEQKRKGFNPGVDAVLKDSVTLEIVTTRLNLDEIEEIKERPGSFRFTGIVSEGFRICDYYYGEESSVEGYVSADKNDVCAIHVSSRNRMPRSYVSPRERKSFLQAQESRDVYVKWRLSQQKAALSAV